MSMQEHGGELPRQTYRTAADGEREDRIAARFAKWAKADQLKIGTDPVTKLKSRVDRALYRGGTLVAFFEIKTRRRSFRAGEYYETGERKLLALRQLKTIVQVPVYYVVESGCGTLFYFDAMHEYERVQPWGRLDRNDNGDIEVGARFNWRALKVINDAQ